MAHGMRTTISLPMMSKWKCSACGTQNVRKQVVMGYGSTNNYDEFLARKKAQEDLERTLKSLQDPNVGNRYDKVAFEGKCSKCGNKEPWSKTQSVLSGLLTVLLFFASILSVYPLMIGFIMLRTGSESAVIAFAPVLIVVICWVALYSWKSVRKKKLHKKIINLPAISLPVLEQIQAPKRPEVPGRTVYAATKQDASDYTEEELKQLPTWKRVEILKQRENENKENP